MRPDWTARRLLYGGMEGKISFFDLESSGHGTLVAIPGGPQIMDLGLSENRRSLLCLCRHHPLSRKMHKPLALQIWDYRALWQVAAR